MTTRNFNLRSAAMLAAAGFACPVLAQCPPSVPTGLTATDGTQCSGVFVNWNDVSGATSYEVWRNTSNNWNNSILVGTSFDSEMTDLTALPGTTYWYWVRSFRVACLPGSNFSGPSSPNTGYRGTTPGTVTNLVASNGTVCNGVFLTWNTVGGSPLYQVWRNTSNNWNESVLVGTSFDPEMTDITALPGQLYYYWVRATALCGNGVQSNMDTGYRGTTAPTPTNLTATSHMCAPLGISITWDALGSSLITEVYRNTTNDLQTASLVGTTLAGGTSWLDLAVLPLTNYYYWVRTQALCGTSGYAGPAWGYETANPLAPTNVVATQGSVCDAVELTWNAPFAVPAASSYRIFRATTDEFSLAQTLNTVPATSTRYEDSNIVPGLQYYYWVIGLNGCGPGVPNIPAATTTIVQPLAITQQPAHQSASVGGSASFSVTASGPGPITYRWRKGGVALTSGGSIAGAGSAQLTINPVAGSDAGVYSVDVANVCGTITSNFVNLTIACYPNCDGSTATPILNVQDFACFLNAFASSSSYANCDGSTSVPVLNVQDFACFLNAFAAGCS